MPGAIRRLDPDTIDRIAAGEVVERPASVVKELVENAIDADASRVRVEVETGGKDRIRVADDGVGMTDETVRLAVEKHTTSKIRDVADLEVGVGTLGFRGEALHAVGAVSRLTVRTRPRGRSDDGDHGSRDTPGDTAGGTIGNTIGSTTGGSRGTELVVEGGEVVSVDTAGCPEGTTVEVDDLFFNVPARRKYLKRDATEFAHVNAVVAGYALANPGVAVRLEHDGRETFATDGRGDLRSAVMAVYGREVAASMVPVERGVADGSAASADTLAASVDLPDGPLSGISGLVSHPETNRASRGFLNAFVNGRYVTASAVREAVVDAYDTQLAPDRYPFAVLSLSVPADAVDVNVHPRKLEVRFADEAGVRRQVRAAVRDALLDEGLVRSSAPRGRSAPEQTEIAPESGGEPPVHDADAECAHGGSAHGGGAPGESAERAGHVEEKKEEGEEREEHEDDAEAKREEDVDVPPEGGVVVNRSEASVDVADDPEETVRATDSLGDVGWDTPGNRDTPDHRDTPDNRDTVGRGSDPHRRFRAVPGQATLGDAPTADEHEFDRLPAMRVLGQLHDTYLLAETADGLVLVDQHAADERVNYERLRERFAGDVAMQTLAEPVELELTAGEAALLDARADALARLGVRASLVGERSVSVSALPALLADAAGPELVRDLLGDFAAGEQRESVETVEAAADRLLADLACYPAIKGNESLTEGSVVDLLRSLDACENPYACPHGRPVLIEFSEAEIEDRFERDYPGHQHRRPTE